MRLFYFIFLTKCILLNCQSLDGRLISKQNLFQSEVPEESGTKAKLTAEHYLISNERRIDLYKPYIQNMGGGYIGVGTDQNLTLAAWTRSEFIWLMDFDPVVVKINKMHIAIIRNCADYECFKNSWLPSNQIKTWELFEKELKNEKDFSEYKKAFQLAMNKNYGIHSRLNELDFMTKNFGFQSFHTDPNDYNHLRQLVLKNRIRALKGDLKRNGTMRLISKIATEMDIPIRIVYTSNAEEYFRFPEEYRQNILALPTDEKSYHVRTFSTGAKSALGFPEGEKYPDQYPFHYNLQKIENLKEWMRFRAFLTPITLMKGRREISKGFSIQESTPVQQKLKETGRIEK